jgi:DNA-binding NtrC family response regulator
MTKLLIVDDEDSYRHVLTMIFQSEGHTVSTAANGSLALEQLKKESFDIIISDVRMPDMDGIQLLKAARELYPDIGIILMTAFGTLDTAREAFKLGADDFLQKPFNNEELKIIVKRTIEKQTVINENRAFKRAQRISGSVKNMIGRSRKMEELFQVIERVARVQSTVLITGESGTGKELVARAIHDLSDRADKPFIPINCGALPETLLEAELFGSKKGTFTGADQNRIGLFESADKGSIFLDEIGDMPPAMQVKILRVLQERRVRPVGGHGEISIDTRVIAATNCNIKQMVEDGKFREDLYYRVAIIPVHIPPLRERREDIPELVEHFIKKYSNKAGEPMTISKKAAQILENREWKGNVRELEHTIERAVALADGHEIAPQHCGDDFYDTAARSVRFPEEGVHLPTEINNFEKEYVEEAMRCTGNNQTRAAERLRIPVHSLRHLLAKHNLQITHPQKDKE